MRRIRLTTKLAVAASLVSAAVILATGVTISVVYYYLSEKDLRTYLADQSQSVTAGQIVYNSGLIMYRPGPGGENLSTRLRDLGLSALILDSESKPVGSYGVYGSLPPDTVSSQISAAGFSHLTLPDGQLFDTYTLPLMSSGSAVGTIQFARQSLVASRLITLNLTILAFILPLAALLNGFVITVFMRRSLSPVNLLIDHLRRTPAREIPKKISLEGRTSDEISDAVHTVNSLLDRVGGSVSRQKAFISHASHELKTPLTAVSSSLDLALLHSGENSDIRRHLLRAKDRLTALNRTINSLLTLSRLSDSGTPVHPAPEYALKPVLGEICTLYRGPVSGKNQSLTLDCPDGLTTSLEVEHLRIIVSNLIDNAVKYSPPASIISVVCYPRGNYVHLSVSDNGPGMTAEEQSHIFDRFYRGRSSVGNPGTGLGMSIVRLVCDLYSLSLDIESSPGHGTRVTVRLPQKTAKAGATISP